MKLSTFRVFRPVCHTLGASQSGWAIPRLQFLAMLAVLAGMVAGPGRALAQSRTPWQPVWQQPPGASAAEASPRYQEQTTTSASEASAAPDTIAAAPTERVRPRVVQPHAVANDDESAAPPRRRPAPVRRTSYEVPAGEAPAAAAPEPIPAPRGGPMAGEAVEEGAPEAADSAVYPDGECDDGGGAPCGPGGCNGGYQAYGAYGNCGPCGPYGPCGPRCLFGSRLEVRADYLLWWGKGDFLPALVTTSPSGTSRDAAGVLGAEGTSVLFGNKDVNDNARSGGRVILDWWLGGSDTVALEASYLGLGDHKTDFSESSQGDPILARPFLNVTTGLQDAGLVAFPNVITGNLGMVETTDFQSAEALLRINWFRQGNRRLDFLIGYRYVRLDDDLQMNENGTSTDPTGLVPVGTTLALNDRFHTLNEFNGLDLGMLAKWRYCRWTTEALLKMAVGETTSHVWIDGSTTIQEPTQAAATSPGGFLALPSNIGHYAHNDLAVVPEVGLTLGYDITCRLKFTMGYSFLYWSKVARPGDQINTNINSTQFAPGTLAGLAAPQAHYVSNDYWAQGLNFGLEYHF